MNHKSLFSAICFVIASVWIGCKEEIKKDPEELHGEHHADQTMNTIVRLDKHKIFHTGIIIEPVQMKSIAVPLKLHGKVSFNERKMAQVTARVTGRIEKLYAFTNDRVGDNEVLVEMYSQEFLTMQFEYIQTAERLHSARESSAEEQMTARSIYESAKRKLIIVGVTEDELRDLETTKTPRNLYQVRAPFSGTIIENKMRSGTFVQVGSDLFALADLSLLWVLADVYEKDLPRIRTGMKATVETNAYPDLFTGTITTVYSVVDEKTRTVKARIEILNRDNKLKPEMFCTASVQTEFGKETIKIPESALLGETEKHFVFVALNDTTFEKRDVRTGVETREFAEILDGLLVGEKIVVKGGFFLKSELAKETFGEEH